MDSTYLKQTVGEPLAEAMAAAVIARPADLTGFIAEYLDNYVKVQEYLVQAAEQKAAVAAAREEAAAINKAASAAAAAVAAEKTAALTELQLLSIVPEPEPKGPIVISNHFKYKDPADKEKVDAILDKIIAYNTEKEMFGPVASTFSFAHEEDGLSYRATEVFPDAAAYETYAGSFSTCPFMEEIMSMVGMVEAVNVEAVTAEDGTVTAEAISGEVLYGELAEMDKSEKLKEFYPTQTRVYAAPGGKGPDMSLFPGVGQFGWTDRAPEAEPETEAEPEGEAEAEAEPEAEGEAEPEPEPPTPLINPEVFPAVIDTLLKHTGFSSVYIASVELKEGVAVGEIPPPQPQHGPRAAAPTSTQRSSNHPPAHLNPRPRVRRAGRGRGAGARRDGGGADIPVRLCRRRLPGRHHPGAERDRWRRDLALCRLRRQRADRPGRLLLPDAAVRRVRLRPGGSPAHQGRALHGLRRHSQGRRPAA